MDKETTKEMVEIMDAYIEGHDIQYKDVNDDEAKWQDVSEPNWMWGKFEYRIKPKKKKYKYDVGDYVLVLDGSNISDYTGDFTDEISEFVGRILQIKECTQVDFLPCYVMKGESLENFYFDERGLALVKIGE